jgi:hypothetical protein
MLLVKMNGVLLLARSGTLKKVSNILSNPPKNSGGSLGEEKRSSRSE